MAMKFWFAILGGTLMIAGCTEKESFKLTYEDLGFEDRRADAFPTNATPKALDQLKPEDVIVAVNGYPLTKRAYDDLMELKFAGILKQKEVSSVVADQMMEQHRKNYLNMFQAQRMLLDEAFKLKIVTTNALLAAVEKKIKADAKRRGVTVEKSLKGYGKRKKYLFQELYISTAMDKLIAEKIPPLHKVDDTFVKAVQEQVALSNIAFAQTNAMIAARMKSWKKQILDKNLDFLDMAQRLSASPDPDGVWGTFEEGDMSDPKMEAAVFALPKNGISDVLEDFNGYHIVKVLDIIPKEVNEKGRVVSKERRKLAHIYIEKIPETIRMDDIKMSRELTRQMQMQAVEDYVTALSTNGTTRIEFPNGTKLFAN